MKVLVTGAAGFIGYHVCERLLARGDTIIGVDNLDTSGDVTLKATRLSRDFGGHDAWLRSPASRISRTPLRKEACS